MTLLKKGMAQRGSCWLRPYRDSDFDAVIQLWWSSWHASSGYRHHRPIADWKDRWHDLAKTHRIVVIERVENDVEPGEGEVVAFAALNLATSVLAQIFVSPECKRQGLGRWLLEWVCDQCPDGFSLKTAADNAEAIAFYESAGFQQAGFSLNDFNGKNEVEFVKIQP